jgi:hypothetical protein
VHAAPPGYRRLVFVLAVGSGISHFEVSPTCSDLDEVVAAFRERRLGHHYEASGANLTGSSTLSQLVSDRPASSHSGSSRLLSSESSATTCNCVRRSGTGCWLECWLFCGGGRRPTAGLDGWLSSRAASLLALRTSSAIELDKC